MGACPFPATPHTNTMTSGPLGQSYRISFSEHAPQPFVTKLFSPFHFQWCHSRNHYSPLLPACFLIAQRTLYGAFYTALQFRPLSGTALYSWFHVTQAFFEEGFLSVVLYFVMHVQRDCVLPSSYKSASCPWPCLGLRWSIDRSPLYNQAFRVFISNQLHKALL